MKVEIIYDYHQIDRVLTFNYDKDKVELKIADLTNANYWENLINKYYNECGCKLGAIVLISGLLLSVALFVLGFLGTNSTNLLYAFLVSISLSFFCKIFKIVYAKVQLRLIVKRIKKDRFVD